MEFSASAWTLLALFTLGFLWMDLRSHSREVVARKQALTWTAAAILLSVILGACIWYVYGAEQGIAFFTTYLLEKTLSIDNLFVIWLIFQRTKIPAQDQHRILFWGILGAIAFRGVCIGLGVRLVEAFEPVLYFFALFLIYSGVQLAIKGDQPHEAPANDRAALLLSKHGRWSPRTDCFLEKRNGKWQCTAALLTLFFIEVADLIFAVDSVPAGLSITREPFILISANICAILGLRSLYFFMTGPDVPMKKLTRAVPWLLIIMGLEMILAHWIAIPVFVSLGFIIVIPALAILLP